jgi:hypothetical protein
MSDLRDDLPAGRIDRPDVFASARRMPLAAVVEVEMRRRTLSGRIEARCGAVTDMTFSRNSSAVRARHSRGHCRVVTGLHVNVDHDGLSLHDRFHRVAQRLRQRCRRR